ncbi:MAG: hypothetical protein IPM48_14480 [Saprospiraceae bacterium]|nr:hypothetical protein [Saprospiraceae bacterium]
MSKLTASYVAGIIDGEGYIGLLRISKGNKAKWQSLREFKYMPCVKVVMTNKEIIDWLYKSFGGTFETRTKNTSPNCRVSYGWQLRKLQAIEFLKIIYPYLMVKRKQAEVLFRYPQIKAGTIISDEVYEKRNKLFEEIKELNKRGAA